MHSIASRLRIKLAKQLRGRILDCGSGDHIFAKYLCRKGNEVISLDVDEEALRKAPGIGVLASCEDTPFPDDCFDAVWSCAVIEHVKEESLPEMIRVAKPSGRLVVVTPNRHSPFDRLKRLVGMTPWDEIEGHVRLYEYEELAFYGPVRGETLFVPFMSRYFWNHPRTAHVWILDLTVTKELKEKTRKRFPDLFDREPPDYARIVLPYQEEHRAGRCRRLRAPKARRSQPEGVQGMLKYSLHRLLRNPFVFIRNAVYKTLIAPRKYARGDDYDARRYWHDRFMKHGKSLRGPGDEGRSEEDNRTAYEQAGRAFLRLCAEQKVDFENASVLEIGVGTGFYTGLLRQAGVRKYLGVDITEVLFERLRTEYPDFEFARKDISTDRLEGRFDVIVMMDVVEHIVSESKLASAMENIKACLAEGGLLVLTGVQQHARKHLFYNRSWAAQEVTRLFPGYHVGDPIPFRDNYLLTICKPAKTCRTAGPHSRGVPMPDKTEGDYPHEAYDEAYYQGLVAEADRHAASHRWRMRWLDEMLKVSPGDRVVDLGAGAGQIAGHLAQRGAMVEAVDLSPAAVALCRRRWRGHGQVNFRVCDATNCSHLGSSAFDKATCCDLIEHVHDNVMFGVFREAHRLLKPAGELYVYSPNGHHWIELLKARNFILKQPVGHIRVRPIVEVVRALKDCGFEIARLARPPSMLPVLRWVERVWSWLPLFPELAIYRVCLLARKPGL